jgi:hypothetical protein
MYKGILFALAATVAGSTAAQTAAKPDPADPKVRTPSVEYRSAFAEYQKYSEPELVPWRAANEEVAAAGGHVGMARGQGKGEDKAQKPAAKPPAHEGHK